MLLLIARIFTCQLKRKAGSSITQDLGNTLKINILHSMIEYPNYEKALIIAGDGDYHCLVDYLTRKKKLLKLMIPDKNKYSSLLRKFMPDIVFMNDLKAKLQYNRTK